MSLEPKEEKVTLKRLRTKDVEWLYPIILGNINKAHDDFMIRGVEDAYEKISTTIVGIIDDLIDQVANKYEK
jgi:hypothetical protein